MIKEIVIESKAFEETITITSETGIDIYKGVVHDIIERCAKESKLELEDLYLSDSDEESEEEVILKHHYNTGCYCETCKHIRLQEKEFDTVCSDNITISLKELKQKIETAELKFIDGKPCFELNFL